MAKNISSVWFVNGGAYSYLSKHPTPIVCAAAAKHFERQVLPWLMVEGSLTALLESKAGQPLQVERSFEGYRVMTLSQKKQMGWTGYRLNRPTMAWVREVLLYGDSALPWVAAQSIFPLSSLKGDAKRLQYLQSTPIGYVLFKRQVSMPHQRIIDFTNECWRRSTVYNWHKRPLMVSETFLPEFFRH